MDSFDRTSVPILHGAITLSSAKYQRPAKSATGSISFAVVASTPDNLIDKVLTFLSIYKYDNARCNIAQYENFSLRNSL
jgi:hypothetical protein